MLKFKLAAEQNAPAKAKKKAAVIVQDDGEDEDDGIASSEPPFDAQLVFKQQDLAIQKPSQKVDEMDTDPLQDYMDSLYNDTQTPMLQLQNTEQQDDANTAIKRQDVEEAIDPLAQMMKRASKKELALVDHAKIKYEPFRRDFYVESPEVAQMSQQEVATLRAELDNVKCRGTKPPRPVRKWTQCGLPTQIYDIITTVLKYQKPTPIQAQALPAIMQGRDVLAVAKTGSGKTMAFLLPMFRQIKDQRPLANNDGPIGIVLAPTRELAMQTFSEARRFAKAMHVRVSCAYGGDSIKDNIADLKRGAEILVCTPGRLIDLLCSNGGRVTNLQRCTYLVLDEADRCFDLGFEQQIMRVLSNVRPDCQRVLFSATFPKQMEALARRVLKYRPLEIVAGEKSVVCSDIDQHVCIVATAKDKFLKLLEILGYWYDDFKDQRLLIFVDRQESADNLLRDLFTRGYKCLSLHGGKDQTDRIFTLQDFKSGTVPIMCATSVAARGLDVPELNVVINYDCPNHAEDYVHRLGRTGRAGRHGTAYTFIAPEDDKYTPAIVLALAQSGAAIPEALTAIKDEFFKKVARGEASVVSSGFGGKGLDRIERERSLMKATQKQSHGAADSDEEAEGDVTAATGDAADAEQTSKDEVVQQEIIPESKVRSNVDVALINATLKAREISRHLGITTQGAYDGGVPQYTMIQRNTNDAVADMFGTSDRANTLTNYVMQQLRISATSRHLQVEVEINDYAEQARARVGSRQVAQQLMDQYGVTVRVGGKWQPPGQRTNIGAAPAGKKLHLLVDGPNKYSVDMARDELRRMLQDATQEAISQDPRLQRL